MNDELFTCFLSEAGLGARPRRWNGNDATDRNHHGLVPFAEQPFDLVLGWKRSGDSSFRSVGCFRLNLANLVKAGYIEAAKRGKVRLRFFHDIDGCVYVQAKPGGSRLLVGKVE